MSVISPTALPVTAPTAAALQPKEIKPEAYTIMDLVLKMFEEKTVYITKTLSYGIFWLGRAVSLPSQASAFSDTMGDFKNILSAAEVPKKTKEAWEALKKTVQTATSTGISSAGGVARDAMEKVGQLINSAVDGVDFGQRFVPINAALMTSLKGISSAATLAGCGSGAIKEVEKLSALKPEETSKRNLYMIKLALNVSYAVIGALGLASALGVATVAPWMFVACLTSGLVWTLGAFFYEKLYDPEGKGKNLNGDIVIENRLAEAFNSRLAAPAVAPGA